MGSASLVLLDSSERHCVTSLANRCWLTCMTDKPEKDEVVEGLPLPEPLEAAVEAGLFGVCADGTLRPGREEIRLLVQEQIAGLTEIAIAIETYVRDEKLDRDPLTGRVARKLATTEAYRRRARKLAQVASMDFVGHLGAYEDAFGHKATCQLHEFVLALAATILEPQEPPKQQLDLF